jgi:hypothetical protein
MTVRCEIALHLISPKILDAFEGGIMWGTLWNDVKVQFRDVSVMVNEQGRLILTGYYMADQYMNPLPEFLYEL